jgi:hemoglobin
MKDIENIEDIRLFVNEFYDKVQPDPLIGPIFMEVIPGDWQPHLDKMYAFWNAVLFGVTGYRGNPFSKHAPLKIERKHFERWIALFNETIDAHFEGAMAEDAKKRAVLMADTFIARLQQMTGGPGKIIV